MSFFVKGGVYLVLINMLKQEEQIFEQINKAKNILITFGRLWEGDSVASSLAMYLFLKKIHKNVDIIADRFKESKHLSFLPAYKEIQDSLDELRKFIISLDMSKAKAKQIKYLIEDNKLNFIITAKGRQFKPEDVSARLDNFRYDLIIVLDTADLESLGKVYDNNPEFFYEVPIINIDHHTNNEEFGQINYIDITAVSTAEILFFLFNEYEKDLIDEDIATCLLAGEIIKTKSFKTQNITPKALSAAAQLVTLGARREEIVNNFYRSRPLGVLKLWGRVLARLHGALNNKLVWSVLGADDFVKTKTSEKDIVDVIDELIINIPQAQIIVVIFELQKQIKAMIYSVKTINSLSLVKEWSPAGTRNLATISLDKSIKEAEREVISVIQEKLKKIPF